MVSPQRKREILGLILMVLSLLLSMAILTYAAGDEPLAGGFRSTRCGSREMYNPPMLLV